MGPVFERATAPMTDDASLILMVGLPYAGSILAAAIPTNARTAAAALAGGVTTICLVIAVMLYSPVASFGAVRNEIDWILAFGLNFPLRTDGFASMFALLVAAIC